MTTLLGSNVGIELAQLMVVTLVMPSLILLNGHPVSRLLRIELATAGALLALGWLAARIGLIPTNPLEPLGDLLVDQPVALATGLGLLASTAAIHRRLRAGRTSKRTARAGTSGPPVDFDIPAAGPEPAGAGRTAASGGR